jgi:hypothetical protein
MLSSPTAATGHLLVLTVRRSPYPIRLLEKLNSVCQSSNDFSANWNETEDAYLPNAVCTEEAAMKMFANLSRFIYHSEPPQPSAAPFDDGLTEIARLIAREDPIKADALPAATTIATERGPRAGVVMPPSMFAATDEVIEGVEPLPELAQQD